MEDGVEIGEVRVAYLSLLIVIPIYVACAVGHIGVKGGHVIVKIVGWILMVVSQVQELIVEYYDIIRQWVNVRCGSLEFTGHVRGIVTDVVVI